MALSEEEARALDDVRRGLVSVHNGYRGATECYLWSAGGRVPLWECQALDRLLRRGLAAISAHRGAADTPLVLTDLGPPAA
ncbi:hypothetical protein [Amycolatopsis sp. PS_44_ISF1]|uniref:hypothetical protein n=1 Tax=Amycolatopsis sp. PS_44_ISF1 TaxID=2974917 RepID=UPI0028DF204E|nr:hypothetical protein [Amycolatopsis sp. PS_44_ISF1]MDT8911831.1 hypothetical protein [Amycolatopsis sp. PS_44_ISF1]